MTATAAPFRVLFTVVVPSYNRAEMLRAALRSVLWQTCQDFECFVVDDGSTDSTPRVFREFERHPRLKWHRFDRNRGQHACRNYAVDRSEGRFITFLDSDDLWLPERLEEFRKAAGGAPEIGFWFSNAYLWRYGRIIGTMFDPRRSLPHGRVPGWYAVGDARLPYVTTNVAVVREAFHELGLFREDLRILEDTELYARILESGYGVGGLSRPLAVRRIHEAQITRDHERDFQESLIALRSGAAPPEVERSFRESAALDAACYLLKGLEPEKARRMLAAYTGPRRGRYWRLYLLGLLPEPLLRFSRGSRRLCLSLRYGLFAPREFRTVARLVRPLIG